MMMRKQITMGMIAAGLCAGLACGTEMEGEDGASSANDDAVQSIEQSASARKTTTVARLANKSSCDVATQLSCAGMVRHCVPFCSVDSNSSACKFCIDQTFTFGIDCWSCLYNRSGAGGSVNPAPEYYSCRSFPSGGPDDTTNPRLRRPLPRVEEVCNPPVYDHRTRRWSKWCCFHRIR